LTCDYSPEALENKIFEEISNIRDPESGQTLREKNLIDYIHINDENVAVVFNPPNKFSMKSTCVYIGKKIKQIIIKVCPCKKINVIIRHHKYEDEINNIISNS